MQARTLKSDFLLLLTSSIWAAHVHIIGWLAAEMDSLKIVAQKSSPPAHAAIILSPESVFAVLGGWLLLGEILSLRGLLGCTLCFQECCYHN